MKRVFVFLGLIALPVSTWADVVWRGDFQTGDRSQWSGTEMVSADRLQIIDAPGRPGRYALRALVRQFDDPIHASGNRNELFYNSHEPMGSEYFYRWSTMFDPSYPSYRTWQVFTQWHQSAGCCGSPPVEFYVNGETMYLRVGPTDALPLWNTPLVRGVWYDFVFHVRWSDNPNVGFVELYLNGDLVLARTRAATNFPGQLNYLKQGLYRDVVIVPDGIIYHDGMIQATSLDDVFPPPPPPPDAGVPPTRDGGGPPADGGAFRPDGGTSDGGTVATSLGSSGNGSALVATGGCSQGGSQSGSMIGLAAAAFAFGLWFARRRRGLARLGERLVGRNCHGRTVTSKVSEGAHWTNAEQSKSEQVCAPERKR